MTMPQPEPPAPTPSATTCAACGKPKGEHIELLDELYCYEFTRYTSREDAVAKFVPPASAPAATPLAPLDGHDWNHDKRTDMLRIGLISAPRHAWIAAIERLAPATPDGDPLCECGWPLGNHYTDGRAYYCTNPHHWMDGEPPKFRPAATAGTEPIRDELSHLTERLMNWLSLAAPESYASRAEAFAWAARAHDLARQRTATSTSTEAT